MTLNRIGRRRLARLGEGPEEEKVYRACGDIMCGYGIPYSKLPAAREDRSSSTLFGRSMKFLFVHMRELFVVVRATSVSRRRNAETALGEDTRNKNNDLHLSDTHMNEITRVPCLHAV